MDDSSALYAPDTTTRLIKLLKGTFGDEYTYFEATPSSMPPAIDFPLMIVQELKMPVILGPTQTDEVHEQISLSIWLNKADDIGSSNIRTTTMRHLKNIVAGADPENPEQYKPGTVCYALRQFLTLDQWLINSDVTITYDAQHSPNAAPTDPMICTADILLQTWRRVMVGGRM